MQFDVFIVGGSAAGISCALILGSAKEKSYAENKKVGILVNSKASDLQNAVFYNVLGLTPGTSGLEVLENGPVHLEEIYPHVLQIKKEKLLEICPIEEGFLLSTNKNEYTARIVVIAVGYSNLMKIKGLKQYIIPHKKAQPSKNRIQLKNDDHLISKNLYVAGTLAGHRSQYAIACGSGAAVATDILTIWNGGAHTKVHDKLK